MVHLEPLITTGPARRHDANDKYLAFHLGAEEYGIRVMKVREIIGIQEITAVPNTPKYVRGVINLRGKVIPVVDLRIKLGLTELADTPRTCIVVAELAAAAGPVLSGIVVDGVSEVLTVSIADVEPAPDFGGGTSVSHIVGIAKVKGKVKILLDLDKILTTDEGTQSCH